MRKLKRLLFEAAYHFTGNDNDKRLGYASLRQAIELEESLTKKKSKTRAKKRKPATRAA